MFFRQKDGEFEKTNII